MTKYITGLGLSETDLGTKDIGIGFMPGQKGVPIYKALLRLNSNTQKTAKCITTKQ